MKLIGPVPAADAAHLAELVAAHRTTEEVFRFVDGRGLPYEILAMDEYTLDIVVRWSDDLTLVYDTT